jgi:DNA-binding NarL/FixJ family response regulator
VILDSESLAVYDALVGAPQTRTVASLPLRMIIWDARVALLPLEVGRDELGAAVVRDQIALRALVALFETYWQRAVPFGERKQSAHDALSQEEKVLLHALDQGARDEEVAAHLGISVRTVRRMVADLEDRLGARSRFQLGVLAHRTGWLS